MLPGGYDILIAVLTYAATCYSESYIDPYILCRRRPLTHRTGLPEAYDEATYSTSLALCSALNGAARNVGCVCTSAGGQVHCDASMADPILFNTHLSWYGGAMWVYCLSACICRSEHPTTIPYPTPQANPISLSDEDYDSEPDSPESAAIDPFGDHGYGTSRGAAGNAVSSLDCGFGCRSDKDCQSCTTNETLTDQYKCRAAAQSRFNPTVGAVTFLSMCLRNIASSGPNNKEYAGKRDEDLPCPCNSTYISHGCCGVKDGLVWEPAGFNLGQLVERG